MAHVKWPEHPLILEINTWTWLHELSEKYGKRITLATIPDEVLAEETKHFDAVWLMGVWRRSPQAQEIAANRPELQDAYRNALPDFTSEDVVGSPYAIYDYAVDPNLGGMKGLQALRKVLLTQGKLLLLDFVPNHVALDHPWAIEHPEFFLQGSEADLESQPTEFFRCGDKIFARGKDPYFPAWPDTLQVNSFSEGYRKKVIDTLREIASFCDGVRCDMGMLMLDDIFQQTWDNRGGDPLQQEFWPEIIGQVKQGNPHFTFFAEVYWDMEWKLQQQGFDYCYDKRLYDRLLDDNIASIKGHLHAEWEYQSRLVRFVENHDEPRAVSSFGIQRSLAAASIALTLPGARLFHYGQQLGKQIKIPVELGRISHEEIIPEIQGFYHRPATLKLATLLKLPEAFLGTFPKFFLKPKPPEARESHRNKFHLLKFYIEPELIFWKYK